MAGFSCPICSENLCKLPAEAAQKYKEKSIPIDSESINISSAPCGHIFHSYCIQKWLSGTLLSSNACPCCRKDIPKRACLPLFPSLHEESFMDDTQNVNSANCDHGEELSVLRKRVTSLTDQLKDSNQLYSLLSEDFVKLNEKNKTDTKIIETWMVRAKQNESYKDIVHHQEKQIEELKTAVKTYSEIDKILKGNSDDIECDMQAYPLNTQSIKSLLETKCALAHELRRASRVAKDCINQKETFLTEKNTLLKKIDNLEKECEEMHMAFANAKDKDNTETSSQSSTQERQKKVFTKRKGPSPEASLNGAAIDSDVDLMESPLSKSKKSFKSARFPNNLNNATIVLSSDTDDDFMSPLNYRFKSSIPGVPSITPPTKYAKKGSSKKATNPFSFGNFK